MTGMGQNDTLVSSSILFFGFRTPRAAVQVQAQPDGKPSESEAKSEAAVSGEGGVDILLPVFLFEDRVLFTVARSMSRVAGSSVGFCRTSLPRTASWSTNSRSRAMPFGASAMVSKCAMKSWGVMPCVPALPRGPVEAAPAGPPPRPVPSRSAPATRRDLRGPAPVRSGSRRPG